MKKHPFSIVAVCFFLSGLAALVYETAWTREFSFVFGTSELAVATVLAAYMAGLAGGAAVAGRIAHRIRRPLWLYGLLELGIAISALLVPAALFLANRLLALLFGGQTSFQTSHPLSISFFYLMVTFVIVMVPTCFMGATLPLLSRHAVRSEHDIGPRVGALYAVNTAGAVGGTLLAAFVLLPALGIRQTVYVAVAINGLVFLIAVYLVRVARLEARDPLVPASPKPGTTRALHFILPLIMVSGALSFTYEVLWVRLLSQLLGGSIYAFATMLASFLAGIAIGSAVASRRANDAEQALRGFVAAQLGIAILTVGAFYLIDFAPPLTRYLDFENPLVLDVTLAMAVLLPSAVCIGATFPFAVRILAREAEDAGPASARVYSWNTAGAIVGAIGAAFVLLPTLGFRGTILLGVTLNLGIAAIAAQRAGTSRRTSAVAALLIGCAFFMVLPGEPWQILRSSPINRKAAPKTGQADFYQVGRGATVLLTRHSPARWRLSTNGLPESMISSPADPPVARAPAIMLGNIGPMLRPEARSMLVIGLGGGVTIEGIPRNIERIDVVEIEAEVIAANRWLGPHRRIDPLDDPRVHLHEGDARSALQLNQQRFDVVAAQASHPWTAGASHLYTREFFEMVANHLEQDGVFVQWVGSRFVDLELIQSLVITLFEHFDYVHVYSGFLFAASNTPLPDAPDFDALRTLDPDLPRRTGLYTAEDFASHLRLDSESSRAFSATAEITTDDRNLLQMRSPGLRRNSAQQDKQRRREINLSLLEHDPLPRRTAAGQFDRMTLIARLYDAGFAKRAAALVAGLEDPLDREAGKLVHGKAPVTQEHLEGYLRRHPDAPRVRADWLRMLLETKNGAHSQTTAVRLTPSEETLIDAHRAIMQSGHRAAAPFDDRLRSITPTHPLFNDAVFLRVLWRLESGDPLQLLDALGILDDAYLARTADRFLVLRARVGQAMGNPELALASLDRIEHPQSLARHRGTLERVRAMLNNFEREGKLGDWNRRKLRTQFRLQQPPMP